MAETKIYKEGAFRFGFTQQGVPYQGDLMTSLPEMPTHAGDVNLSKTRSRAEYANAAAETWAVEKESELAKELKQALTALYIRLSVPNKTAGRIASRSTRTRGRGTLGGCRPSSRSAPSAAGSDSATTKFAPPPTGSVPAFRWTRSRAGRCEGLSSSS